jgi:predicted Zn-dependent protease
MKIDRKRARWWKISLSIVAIAIILIFGSKIFLNAANEPAGLPKLQVHPLPESLALLNEQIDQSNYFDRVKPSSLGYLIWSQFPVKVYLNLPTADNAAANLRWQEWEKSVDKAIAEWNVYLPLVRVTNSKIADIIILPSQPERKIRLNPQTGLYDIPRAIAAQTNYKFYLRDRPQILAHRMTISLPPNTIGESLLATIRHEMGHALGIWGHSPKETDALFFSQVRDPRAISPRDINTLQKIYQQPTRLGWTIPQQ